MPFIAICPHCRVCRLRAPKAKRGKTVRCPKCQEVFALIPHDEADSTTEGSMLVTQETATPSQSSTTAVENHPDDAMQLMQLALGSVGVVLLLSQLPYGRPVAVVIAFLGSIVITLGAIELKKRAWLGWGGLILNAFLLLILIAYPGALGMTGWWPGFGSNAEATESNGTKGEWIDAGDAAWQQGGVRVGVTFATIGSDPSSNASYGAKERFLWVGLKVTNVGAGNELEFSGWTCGSAEGPVLTTPDGTLVATKKYMGPKGKTIVQQGRFVECMLAFEVPPSEQDLLLDLPTQPFGDATLIRFRIPHILIGKQ